VTERWVGRKGRMAGRHYEEWLNFRERAEVMISVLRSSEGFKGQKDLGL